jgi:hypothetical protein
LLEATLAWCREAITKLDPSFDVSAFEAKTRARVRAWERGDPTHRLWRALRDAAGEAADYLKANPGAVEHSFYAAMLEGFFSAPCLGHEGAFSSSIGERLQAWGRAYADEQKMEKESARTRLVETYGRGKHLLWWGDRMPTERDLAIVTLLGGCIPESALRRQKNAVRDADRLTVLEVVQAEESAIPTLRSRKRRPA